MQNSIREIAHRFPADVRREGGGTLITRWFVPADIEITDPFLLFDQTKSTEVDDYKGGFPEHPHRGFEALTYMLSGTIKHNDSAGFTGDVGPLGTQWLTNASGLTHDEIPDQTDGLFWCLQLWINIPAKNKYEEPFYDEYRGEQIPVCTLPDGGTVRVVAGSFQGTNGPLPPKPRASEPVYLDVCLENNSVFTFQPPAGFTVLIFCVENTVLIGKGKDALAAEDIVVLERDGEVKIETENNKGRFLLMAGKPINEKIAWHGPFVMNTDEELEQAFEDFSQFGPFRADAGTGQDNDSTS